MLYYACSNMDLRLLNKEMSVFFSGFANYRMKDLADFEGFSDSNHAWFYSGCIRTASCGYTFFFTIEHIFGMIYMYG
ncbi:hypothetical protein GGC63_002015 [Paenibacillus sp. OAS669]|nr:hypothetical protein [Paenibacillus sp. OAS669]